MNAMNKDHKSPSTSTSLQDEAIFGERFSAKTIADILLGACDPSTQTLLRHEIAMCDEYQERLHGPENDRVTMSRTYQTLEGIWYHDLVAIVKFCMKDDCTPARAMHIAVEQGVDAWPMKVIKNNVIQEHFIMVKQAEIGRLISALQNWDWFRIKKPRPSPLSIKSPTYSPVKVTSVGGAKDAKAAKHDKAAEQIETEVPLAGGSYASEIAKGVSCTLTRQTTLVYSPAKDLSMQDPDNYTKAVGVRVQDILRGMLGPPCEENRDAAHKLELKMQELHAKDPAKAEIKVEMWMFKTDGKMWVNVAAFASYLGMDANNNLARNLKKMFDRGNIPHKLLQVPKVRTTFLRFVPVSL